MSPTFTVCISTIRPETLGAAIVSIRRQTWDDWELVVVGQGDERILRAATDAAAHGDRRVRYVHLDRHGLSAARNAGLGAASGAIVAMIDDDCEADTSWLATLERCFAADPRVGVVGGSLIAPPPEWRGPSTCLSFTPGEILYDPIATPPPAPLAFDWYGANFAIRRAVADRIGPFDEFLGAGALFPAGEDQDYKFRLEDAGITMRSTPRAIVVHASGRRYGMREVARYWTRNATGVGAMIAKRAILGDRRAPGQLRYYLREYAIGWLRPPRPDRLVSGSVRLRSFLDGYRRCRREFRVDISRGVLEPVVSTGRRYPVANGG